MRDNAFKRKKSEEVNSRFPVKPTARSLKEKRTHESKFELNSQERMICEDVERSTEKTNKFSVKEKRKNEKFQLSAKEQKLIARRERVVEV